MNDPDDTPRRATGEVAATAVPDAAEQPAGAEPRGWWRAGPFLAALTLATALLGQFFLGLIAILLLVSDTRRSTEARLAGAAVMVWALFTATPLGAGPWVGLLLLGAAAGLWGRLAWRTRRRLRLLPAAGAVAAAALAVVHVVPYGLRAPTVSPDEAVQRALTARGAGRVAATRLLVERSRLRVVQRPFWYVVFYEPHPDKAFTADREPCFSRAETLTVDGLDGRVRRVGVADARARDGGCLALPQGTGRDLRPVPVVEGSGLRQGTGRGSHPVP